MTAGDYLSACTTGSLAARRAGKNPPINPITSAKPKDQGYVRVVETEGKKVYHITPEGERFLEENRGVLDEIFDRVRETVRDFAGGDMGEIHSAFGRVAKVTFGRAWRRGPEHPSLKQVAEILRKTADDIELAWETKK